MKKIKNSSQGFTLLELLVVVLIIGILAAIALPQYKMAVGRSKYATLKSITKSLAEAAQRYYLIHDTQQGTTLNNLDIKIPSTINCYIYQESSEVKCSRKVFGTKVEHAHDRFTGLPKYCLAESNDRTDMANRLCQKETGKMSNQGSCPSYYCTYFFNF